MAAMDADGMTTEEILAGHPGLTREDIHESLLTLPRRCHLGCFGPHVPIPSARFCSTNGEMARRPFLSWPIR
jgi:hypothetical protein